MDKKVTNNSFDKLRKQWMDEMKKRLDAKNKYTINKVENNKPISPYSGPENLSNNVLKKISHDTYCKKIIGRCSYPGCTSNDIVGLSTCGTGALKCSKHMHKKCILVYKAP
jgi:hypothetical protein